MLNDSSEFYNIDINCDSSYKELHKKWKTFHRTKNTVFYSWLFRYLQCVTGDCPLAIKPSHNWITLGTPMIHLEWCFSYDRCTKK